MSLRSLLSGVATGNQSIFVRREIFRVSGGYPDIPLMEDLEFKCRVKRHGRLACLQAPMTTAARKWEREGVLRKILLMWMLRFLFFVNADPARPHTL